MDIDRCISYVSLEVCLDPGEYALVASTFAPGQVRCHIIKLSLFIYLYPSRCMYRARFRAMYRQYLYRT